MSEHGDKVVFENDRVRVVRVKLAASEHTAQNSRNDRLVVYLGDAHIQRAEGGKKEEIRRKKGDVVWRSRSQHQVHALDDGAHEVLIVEFKS
jgi:hypothetical protein